MSGGQESGSSGLPPSFPPWANTFGGAARYIEMDRLDKVWDTDPLNTPTFPFPVSELSGGFREHAIKAARHRQRKGTVARHDSRVPGEE